MDAKAAVKKAVKGDAAAFAQLIETKKAELYRIAYSYAKNRDDAMDIVGEAVYKAFVSVGSLRKPEYFNTWLTRILINCAVDHLNKAKKTVRTAGEVGNGALVEPGGAGGTEHEAIMDLYGALDRLDTKHRTVIILKFFHDLTLAEIARVLEWPVGTVKTYLYRALQALNISLKEGEEIE